MPKNGTQIKVPMREISLAGKEEPLRVYDTSGPLGIDPREGLPALRLEWIKSRGDVESVERMILLNSDHTRQLKASHPSWHSQCHPDALCPKRHHHT